MTLYWVDYEFDAPPMLQDQFIRDTSQPNGVVHHFKGAMVWLFTLAVYAVMGYVMICYLERRYKAQAGGVQVLVCPTIMEWVVLAYTFKLNALPGKLVLASVILTEIAAVYRANNVRIRSYWPRLWGMLQSVGRICLDFWGRCCRCAASVSEGIEDAVCISHNMLFAISESVMGRRVLNTSTRVLQLAVRCCPHANTIWWAAQLLFWYVITFFTLAWGCLVYFVFYIDTDYATRYTWYGTTFARLCWSFVMFAVGVAGYNLMSLFPSRPDNVYEDQGSDDLMHERAFDSMWLGSTWPVQAMLKVNSKAVFKDGCLVCQPDGRIMYGAPADRSKEAACLAAPVIEQGLSMHVHWNQQRGLHTTITVYSPEQERAYPQVYSAYRQA